MRIRIVLLTLTLLGLGVMGWTVMRAPYPPAGWVSVEAPREVSVNQPLRLRVTLTPPTPEGMLVVTLHGFIQRREPIGYLSGGTPQLTGTNGGVFPVEITVPDRPGLKQVQVILYVGPTAHWSDRQMAAKTVEIPVVRRTVEGRATNLSPVLTFEAKSDPTIDPQEVPWVRTLTGLLWGVVALLLGFRGIPSNATSAKSSWSSALALACLMAAIVEWSRINLTLADAVRTWAVGHRLYWDRRWLQQGATLMALIGSATATVLALVRLKSLRRGLLLFSLVGFALISLAEAFSLHEIDRLLALKVGPLPLIQITKLALVLMAMVVWIRPAGSRPLSS